jgi:hypothetical protein
MTISVVSVPAVVSVAGGGVAVGVPAVVVDSLVLGLQAARINPITKKTPSHLDLIFI